MREKARCGMKRMVDIHCAVFGSLISMTRSTLCRCSAAALGVAGVGKRWLPFLWTVNAVDFTHQRVK